MKTQFTTFIFSFLIASHCFAFNSFEEKKKGQMIQDLELIKHHFEIGYAPADWKKEHLQWDLEKAFEEGKNKILSTPSITTKQFQQIVKDFTRSMNDHHVNVLFFSTESSALPFSVKGAKGRYFIEWIDTLRLPSSHYDIHVGDELLEFDQKPIAKVIKELNEGTNKSSNPKTDQREAELMLTVRNGMAGDVVPKGPIVIKTKNEAGKITTNQIHWSYTPEKITNPFDFLDSVESLWSFFKPREQKPHFEVPSIFMSIPYHEIYSKNYAERKGGLGASKSFVPELGDIVWKKELPEEKKEEKPSENLATDSSSEESIEDLYGDWEAYIYKHPSNHLVGYIRIPHYIGTKTEINQFGEIINYMEQNTDALVIDQVHNFGGLVTYCYELASILTGEPLRTPYHQIKITQKDAFIAYKSIETINLLDLLLGEGSEEAEEEPQESANKEAYTFQQLMFLKNYYELIIEDWNQGKVLSRPTPILGVDCINPHSKYRYTKPILMLIDEMDFSGGDFMPAILQDNKRATLFGTCTAGAGGYVYGFQFPNSHGIAQCTYTASIAERINKKKIENLGVSPDISYQITLKDLQKGYPGYKKAVNNAVSTLLNNGTEIRME